MPGISLPGELLRSLEKIKEFDAARFIEVHENGEQVVSVRYNPSKVKAAGHFPGSEPVPWSSSGVYLPARPSFTLDPWLHAGAYYVQEASGMFLEQCLRQTVDLNKSIKVLDLCAAPGGKSTLIQSLISDRSLLVSNEVIKSRINILSENLIKWGGANTIITNNDPRDFARLSNYFDVMAVDAPCSGSGLFRRDPEAINEWGEGLVSMCSQRQRRILADAYPALKQNGILIYSTCSYSVEEDEEVCDWLCKEFDLSPVRLEIAAEWNITETFSDVYKAPGYRFFPDKLRGEGLFVACFRKNDGGEDAGDTKKSRLNRLSSGETSFIRPWFDDPGLVGFYHQQESVLAFPLLLEDALARIGASLYIKRAGIFCGKIAHGALVPDHELAVSTMVSHSVHKIELDKEQALQYLRKEEVNVNMPVKGWTLVQYDELSLGWMKSLGNRSNNYYPKEWRILKSGNS